MLCGEVEETRVQRLLRGFYFGRPVSVLALRWRRRGRGRRCRRRSLCARQCARRLLRNSRLRLRLQHRRTHLAILNSLPRSFDREFHVLDAAFVGVTALEAWRGHKLRQAGLPKLVSTPGLERRYTDESGVEHMELPIETPGQGIEYREMGPTMLQPQTQPGIPQQPPGTLPRTQAAPPAPTAAPTPAPTQRQYTYGPPKVETAEQALHTRFLDLAAKHQRGEQLNAEEQGIYQDNLGRWGKEVPASDDYLGHLSD